MAARWIERPARVADVGCWDMSLERLLVAGSTYVPVDLVARDERTIVVNLNERRLPLLDVDCVVALGVLEYLESVPDFFRDVAKIGSNLIYSYNYAYQDERRNRANLDWVNGYTVCEILTMSRLFLGPPKSIRHVKFGEILVKHGSKDGLCEKR
jgi:hypothetical protein